MSIMLEKIINAVEIFKKFGSDTKLISLIKIEAIQSNN